MSVLRTGSTALKAKDETQGVQGALVTHVNWQYLVGVHGRGGQVWLVQIMSKSYGICCACPSLMVFAVHVQVLWYLLPSKLTFVLTPVPKNPSNESINRGSMCERTHNILRTR
eukprot:TRINITY_DN15423_c0_g1_i1.p1 TRINITY_DN15423_c0_g1~~TRINITY_DN15423_c0_g1_i1.p1  ORF type:complete len:113 (+),score=2.27 TRINITY_DN15423_c0_g1_i1:194-532(+)